jgi:hypothetical protein
MRKKPAKKKPEIPDWLRFRLTRMGGSLQAMCTHTWIRRSENAVDPEYAVCLKCGKRRELLAEYRWRFTEINNWFDTDRM